MNDHYARILHDDRMAELRREASGRHPARRRSPRPRLRIEPAPLIANLHGWAHRLIGDFTDRGPRQAATEGAVAKAVALGSNDSAM